MKIGNIWMGIGFAMLVGGAGMAGAGCGDGGKKPPASYGDISASFAHPSGTLAATNADAVAQAYQASLSSGLGTAGTVAAVSRFAKPTGLTPTASALQSTSSAATAAQSYACPYGGSISATVNGIAPGATSFSESFRYDNCCESAGCCLNGGGDLFYAQGGAFCESFAITGTCSASPITLDYSICEDTATGMLNYLIEVQGESFAVSGSYSNGSGTLMISGANGAFTCRYTNHTGTCSGTAGTFAF
ncbi:MAG TPA: hypothetical protein VHU40_02415 [Polyangia bacterium]|nr:hypothetical protein [Polyangia bacterium]